MSNPLWITPAWADIAAERLRQIEVEGYTPERDDATQPEGELARAAACYAASDSAGSDGLPQRWPGVPKLWPWHADWWRPTTRRRDLVKAAALIIAEIERLDREAARG